MKIRIYNARILTMSEPLAVTEGELWVEDGRITYIGDDNTATGGSVTEEMAFDREIDAKGNLLMPAFKNAHTHSAMTFLRSYADDYPLDKWLNEQIFPMEAKLTGEDIYHLSKLAFMEYLTSGISTCFDMYFYPEDMAKAATETGMRVVMCGAVNNFSESVEKLEEYYNRYNDYNELVSYRLGMHAEYTTSTDIMKGIAGLCEKYKAPFYTHASETIKEVQECVGRHGMTPPVLFKELGLFQYGGGIFHGVHVSDEDIALLKECGVGVALNPASNCKLASGVAPVKKMLEKDVLLAIGTDGPASNNALDMFREMYLTTALQKVTTADAAAVPGEEVLCMATVGGAKLMGLDDCDVLAEGKKADIIMIDLHQPNMQPMNHIVRNIVYSGSKQNVKMTMVNGRVLYEDGQFYIGEEPEYIYRKSNEIVARMTK